MAIRTVVWGENIHERENAIVRDIYPDGMHATIASALNKDPEIEATTATLQEPEHGLPVDRLAETDVLVAVPHERAARVAELQLMVLHCLCDAVDFQLMGEQAP